MLKRIGVSCLEYLKKWFRRQPISATGYTDLYHEILINIREDIFWEAALLVVLACIAPIPYLFQYGLIPFTLPVVVEVLSIVLSVFVIALIIFLMISGSQNIKGSVLDVAANMIIFYPSPYQCVLGLDYVDIQQLKRVAEIEQNSADWRGNFVSFVIIAFLGALIANSDRIWRYLIIPVVEMLNSDNDIAIPGLVSPRSYEERVIGIGLVIFVIGLLLYKWLTYFREFFSSEFANRVILLACEEVSALYRTKHLSQTQHLLFRERRALIEQLGYHLVASHKTNIIERGWAPMELGEDGLWILIPPAKYSTTARVSVIWKRLRIYLGRNSKQTTN